MRLKKIVAFSAGVCMLAISLYILASPVMAGPVPDTGQTGDYTATFGEDSDYSINPQSYTKLDAAGNPLPDAAASWCMVKDNVTGLIWEVKTDDDSINDKDNTYTWDKALNEFIPYLNDNTFGGFSDWRLPNREELAFIVNRQTFLPAINTDYFPNTKLAYYRSSTTYANNTDNAWFVSFIYGCVGHDAKSNNNYVRAVRGGQ